MHSVIVMKSRTIIKMMVFLKNSIIHIVKVVPPQLLSSSSEGATVHPVPIAFSPVNLHPIEQLLHFVEQLGKKGRLQKSDFYYFCV